MTLAERRACRESCVMTGRISPYPRVCEHGRLWKLFAHIDGVFYWHRISRRTHPITYYRARKP